MATHDMHAGHHHADIGPHGSLAGYLTGFALSVILTAIPFWLVMGGIVTDRTTGLLVLGALAVAQILVHMVCFLHMNGRIEGGWTMLSTLFTVVFVVVGIAGTLWVMYHMNANMMPAHPAVVTPALPLPDALAP
jgi:cytochrome o ubiquinol oxidase operon protein cyoD